MKGAVAVAWFVTTTLLLLLQTGKHVATATTVDDTNAFRDGDSNGHKQRLPRKRRNHKWFAAIRRKDHDEFLCSGFLVGKRHVITARDCVDSETSVTVEVGYFCTNRGNCQQENDFVSVRKRHDKGDMTLLVLEKDVSMAVQPAIPHLEASVPTDQKLQLIGAGRAGSGRSDDADHRSSFFVRELPVHSLGPEGCESQPVASSSSSSSSSSTVCSVPIKRDCMPCAGDAGSALVLPPDTGLRHRYKKKKKQLAKARDVVVAVHISGHLPTCEAKREVPSQERLVLRHFPLSYAADLLQRVICESDTPPEDWCPPMRLRASVFRRLSGHKDSIAIGELSFHPHSDHLLSASRDGTVKLWNPSSSGRAQATFAEQDGSKLSAAQFHPSQPYLASVSFDSIQIWSYKDHNHLMSMWKNTPLHHIFHGHEEAMLSVAWSPCGTRLASASVDGTIKIWRLDFSTRNEPSPPLLLATLTGHRDWVSSVTFHPEGNQLASASFDGTIMLWDTTADSFNLVKTLTGHADWVFDVAYSPSGKWLASGSGDGTAKVWDTTKGEATQEFREHSASVRAVTWNKSNERILATGSWDGTVRLWDVAAAAAVPGGGERQAFSSSLVVLQDPDGHAVHGLDWNPDGTLLAAGYYHSGVIIVWNISKQEDEDQENDGVETS